MSPLGVSLPQRWPLVVYDIDVWSFELVRLARANVFAPLWRWVCRPIFRITSLALPDLSHWLLMFAIKDWGFDFEGVPSLAYSSVRVFRRFRHCVVDENCNWDAVLADGQRMVLHSNNAIWAVSVWNQILVWCWSWTIRIHGADS